MRQLPQYPQSQQFQMLRKSLSLMAALTLSPLLLDDNNAPDTRRHAVCILYPHESKVRGVVSFSQDTLNDPTKIACMVRGLNPKGSHGIHIHEFGDLTQGCSTAGAHFNPHNTVHGGPSSEKRHVGDLGNLTADEKGDANVCFSDKVISLFGEHSVLGRSVVVHAKQDDLGKTDHPESPKTGNSGPRVACGVIGLAKEFRGVPAGQEKEKGKESEGKEEEKGKESAMERGKRYIKDGKETAIGMGKELGKEAVKAKDAAVEKGKELAKEAEKGKDAAVEKGKEVGKDAEKAKDTAVEKAKELGKEAEKGKEKDNEKQKK